MLYEDGWALLKTAFTTGPRELLAELEGPSFL